VVETVGVAGDGLQSIKIINYISSLSPTYEISFDFICLAVRYKELMKISGF
jgi:hypothetical protein